MAKEYKWYILNVVAGQENKVLSEIKSAMIRGITKDFVKDAIVPSKTVIKIKRGQKKEEIQKLFPGYVFVNSNLEGDTYNVLRSIPKVSGFLGGKNNPEPVSEDKINKILQSIEDQIQKENNAIFEIGDSVKINEGPFETFTAVVEKFDQEKKKIKVSVSIFGRATDIELDINQVEKIS